jgi:uncharacterized protein YbjT (DUF2867 family)
MKKVLVTGASGFLGSHVADALSDAGYEVTLFDLSESQYKRHDQKMVTGDIIDCDSVDSIIAGQDIVYHFAGIADIDECSTRPAEKPVFNALFLPVPHMYTVIPVIFTDLVNRHVNHLLKIFINYMALNIHVSGMALFMARGQT